MTELPSPLAVACHDAGAANLALAWLEASPPAVCRAVMEGPAATLAAGSPTPLDCQSDLARALDGAAAVLTGTGWASDLEHRAREMARERGIPSIAILDHWVNYPERFERAGETVLPDALWVADEYALAEARCCFPGTPVHLRPNLYLEKALRRINSPPAEPSVLYLLEPARGDWGRGEPGEFQALDYFMRNRRHCGLPEDAPVRLRPHPSDAASKYDTWIARHPGASLDTAPDLASALSGASWAAGCETAALAVALAAGRRTVCTLPPWAPECRLPHRGLVHLKRIVLDYP